MSLVRNQKWKLKKQSISQQQADAEFLTQGNSEGGTNSLVSLSESMPSDCRPISSRQISADLARCSLPPDWHRMCLLCSYPLLEPT